MVMSASLGVEAASFGLDDKTTELLFHRQLATPSSAMADSAAHLAANVRRLREERGLSQQRVSQLAGVPRPTWASLESGSANPTLSVLSRVAAGLQVSIEELIGAPRTAVRFFPAGETKERKRQGARLRRLVPEALPGLDISRMELAPGGQMVGVPHTAGTREYLTCERGKVELVAGGERWVLAPGDGLVFRGDQKHSYRNPDGRQGAVAISVVCFAPVEP
jgi:transcriptional regulator with XRE-family HTH domain